jgi:hypothetical protein
MKATQKKNLKKIEKEEMKAKFLIISFSTHDQLCLTTAVAEKFLTMQVICHSDFILFFLVLGFEHRASCFTTELYPQA